MTAGTARRFSDQGRDGAACLEQFDHSIGGCATEPKFPSKLLDGWALSALVPTQDKFPNGVLAPASFFPIGPIIVVGFRLAHDPNLALKRETRNLTLSAMDQAKISRLSAMSQIKCNDN